MNPSFLHTFLLIVLMYSLGISGIERVSVESQVPIGSDYNALISLPHRLTGSAEGHKTAAFIQKRLKEIGVKNVFTIDMPVWTLKVEKCQLTVGNTTVDLSPMKPNVTIPPVTPKQGISGPLIYAGNGDLKHYSRLPEHSIVVFDYNCLDNWKSAFLLGASAVIFIGSDTAVFQSPKFLGLPTNIIRLFAPESTLQTLDIKKNYPLAHITSTVTWKKSYGSNIVAFIPGSEPTKYTMNSSPEAVAVSAHYDTWGDVPFLNKGARGAANVAGLLNTVEYFTKNIPKRNMIFMFLDGKAFYHQGARAVYSSLLMKDDEYRKYYRGVSEELVFRTKVLSVLQNKFTGGSPAIRASLFQLYERTAEFIRNDENFKLSNIRLKISESKKADSSLQKEKKRIESVVQNWDNARRAIGNRTIGAIDPQLVGILTETISSRLQTRIAEINELLHNKEQMDKLRECCSKYWIDIHVSLDFSDKGTSWAPIVGDNSDDQFKSTYANTDNPGYYGRVFKVFRDISKQSDYSLLNPDALKDPVSSKSFIPGLFASDGLVAGTYGIYNVSFLTCNDPRKNDGQPSDIPSNLDLSRINKQVEEANRFLFNMANSDGLSIERVFTNVARYTMSYFTNNNTGGPYICFKVTGSLSEDRPATDAILAIIPNGPLWLQTNAVTSVPGFERFLLSQVDANGFYSMVGVRKQHFGDGSGDQAVNVLGTIFDSSGNVIAISNAETLNSPNYVALFPARSFTFVYPPTVDSKRNIRLNMNAKADASFSNSRFIDGESEGFGFLYVHKYDPSKAVKIFDKSSVILLGSSFTNPNGVGLPLNSLNKSFPISDSITADNIWELNESRFGILRSKNVSNVDLEILHNKARHLLEKSKQEKNLEIRTAGFAQSAAISRQIYDPLRNVMDDLIKAIVILLLLAIPFAFALERLILCASNVYMRIAGFAGAFFITFALLYIMHPGFSIASTPVMVFLAFAIILLSGMVINIMIRKFKTELMAFQGMGNRLHSVQISRTETLMVAVNMGMSTMRRRPIRTILTAITAIMLTFTILCFASFNNSFGVKSFYSGPVNDGASASLLIRTVNYQPLAPSIFTVLKGREGKNGLVTGQWWVVNKKIAISKVNGSPKTAFLDAVLGVSPLEIERWKEMSQALSSDTVNSASEEIKNNGVFLPSIIQRQLELIPGDSIAINGFECKFSGVFDEFTLQRLRYLDGQSIVPVNFSDPSYDTTTALKQGMVAADKIKVQRDFTRMSANQIVVASDILVRNLGGSPYVVTFYTPDIGIEELGKQVAEITALPVWTRKSDGVDRMIFTSVASISGGFALFVPLLLGGLIIFGTLLGSITDRQKEIYTFSALGLGPAHVGFLFVAEAAVYAIVGGMGGEILAQGFAYITTFLARHGVIQQPSLNFSSTQSLVAIGIVMFTILISAIYPAIKASKSANPGVQRNWKMPVPKGDVLSMRFPFTVSAYDITGVVSFLAEHFRRHDDAGLGKFAAQNVKICRNETEGHLQLLATLSLAPFDLGITQDFLLTAAPSEIPGVDEVLIKEVRISGAVSDWTRANRTFIQELRKQFLLWRTLSNEYIEYYRMQTLQELGGEMVNQPNEMEMST